MAVWTTPTNRSTGFFVTATVWDNELIGNLLLLKTELSDLGIVQRAMGFRGLHLRTHPDADQAASKVSLLGLDEAVMQDGGRYSGLSSVLSLTLDMTTTGAGGLQAARVASTWYRTLLIGKSSTKSISDLRLFGIRMKNYLADQTQTSNNSTQGIRQAAGNTKVGQTFQVSTANLKLEMADVKMTKTAAPTGRIWLEVQDNGGTVLATSDKMDVSGISTGAQVVRFVFRTPYAAFATATTYRLAIAGDFTIDGVNFVSANYQNTDLYASGTAQTYNGTTWANIATSDLWFKVYLTQNDSEISDANILSLLPSGYDEYCKLAPIYNNASNVVTPFLAYERNVRRLLSSLFASTLTFPSLQDLSAVIPPMSLALLTQANNSAIANYVALAGVPDGYGLGAVAPGELGMSIINSPGAGFLHTHADVHTDYQGLYVTASAGTANVYILGYRW
jgi:hypothetical protein